MKHWGYQVGPKEESYRWMKILLEKNDKSRTWKTYRDYPMVKHTDKLLRSLQKTPEEAVSDYLREIWNYTKEDIRKREPNWETDYNIRIILTVPAVWSDSAKDKTIRAAEKAGLKNIQRVSEPEAAALATLRLKGQQNTIKVISTYLQFLFSISGH